MGILRVTHNAGFFSCCNIRLMDIVAYYNQYKRFPDRVDSSSQFANYKVGNEDLMPLFFDSDRLPLDVFNGAIALTTDVNRALQFSDYKQLIHKHTRLLMNSYFQLSGHASNIAYNLSQKYKLDPENTCAVFYRGNDKARETQIAPYEEFIQRTREVREKNPGVKFLVQPDETEFLEAFLSEFPGAIYFSETPHMRKKDSVMFNEMPRAERAEFGARFLAAVLLMSHCKYLITHSGSCGLFCVLYRGHSNNVIQYLNGEWL